MGYSIEKARLVGEYKSTEYGTSSSKKYFHEASILADLLGYKKLDAKKIIEEMKLRDKKKRAKKSLLNNLIN